MTVQKAIVMALLAIWLGMSLYALWLATTLPATGDGFTRGADRAMAVLSREIYATVAGIAAWLLGRRLPTGTWLRRLSKIPIGVLAQLGRVTLGAMAWAVVTG
jgi:hypothetical protein